MKKKIRIRRRKKTSEPEPEQTLDIIEEQVDNAHATRYSKDAEIDMKKVAEHPERYIEINIVKKSRVVDSFFIFADKPKFQYKKKLFHIREDGIYLLPRKGFFIPTSFYYETNSEPIGFKQTNKGITGKAMTLLYKHGLYETLLSGDDPSLNKILIFMILIQLVLWGVTMYFLFFHNPEQVTNGGGAIQPAIIKLPFLGVLFRG
jgi:hypothetical protein